MVSLICVVYHFQRKLNNPPGNKKGGNAKKDSKSDAGGGSDGKSDADGKTEGETSTDLAAVVGGLSLDEQPKAE